MRVPLTLLVASCNSFDVQAAEGFDALGARALPVPSQFVSQALFSPKLVVDALVVDATTVAFLPGMILPLGDAPIRAAEMLVKELLRLSPSQRMPNGVPWKDIPLVVLVDEHNYDAFHAHCRHHASSVVVYKIPSRYNAWAYQQRIPAGWDRVYGLIERTVQDWTFELVERNRSQGWILTESTGSGQKYESKKNDFDPSRLSPTSKPGNRYAF